VHLLLYGNCVPTRPASSVFRSRGEWSASRPGRSTAGTHWIGGWVGLTIGMDDVEPYKYSEGEMYAFA
jgi:hypothetical protein